MHGSLLQTFKHIYETPKKPRYPVLLRFLFPVQVFPLRPYIQQQTAIMFTSYRTACMHFIRSWLVEANCVLALMAEAANFPASNAEIPLQLERACCLFGVGWPYAIIHQVAIWTSWCFQKHANAWSLYIWRHHACKLSRVRSIHALETIAIENEQTAMFVVAVQRRR